MEQISQINNNCSTKATLQACANNVPYLVIVSDGCCDDQVLKYVNLNTGVIETSMPVGLTIGACAAEVCMKEYKDACANGVPYLVAISDDCSSSSVAGLEFINLITGGKTTTAPANLQYYSCEAIPTQSCVAFLETETFVATAGQTTFNIANVASGDVRLSRNGSTLADAAAAVSGTTVTYVPSANNNEALLADDRIEISYIYVSCDQAVQGYKDCIGNDIPANTELVTCAALNPDHFSIDPVTGQVSSLCCDGANVVTSFACWEYTQAGTAQSPANGTKVVPLSYDAGLFDCTTDLYGSVAGIGGMNLPYYVAANSPMVVNDDNGMACSGNVRLDNGDVLGSKFQGYNGVKYSVAAILRKISADGLGAAGIVIEVKRPDGTFISNVASATSTREGGGGGWDNVGSLYGGSGGIFTANQTGEYEVRFRGITNAPARINALQTQVYDASTEVIENVVVRETLTVQTTTINGVSTSRYFKSNGTEVFPPSNQLTSGTCTL